jgi:hypothetical protein
MARRRPDAGPFRSVPGGLAAERRSVIKFERCVAGATASSSEGLCQQRATIVGAFSDSTSNHCIFRKLELLDDGQYSAARLPDPVSPAYPPFRAAQKFELAMTCS